MSIGLGLVLAAIIVSLTLLYISRHKDINLSGAAVHRTKRLQLRAPLLILLAVSVCIVGVYSLYDWITSMPRKQDSYQGIKLGMSMKEVEYIRGRPTELSKQKMVSPQGYWASVKDPTKLDTGESIFDYPEWAFPEAGKVTVDIDFDKPNGKVVSISCYQITDAIEDLNPYVCDPLSGIRVGTSEADLKKRLGTPDAEAIDNTKEIVFRKYNARFILERQKVYYIELREPEWVEGSNLTVEKGAFDPSTAKEKKSGGRATLR